MRTLGGALLVTLLVAGCATTSPAIPDNVETVCVGCEKRPELLNRDEVARARGLELTEFRRSLEPFQPGDRREYRAGFRILVGEDGSVLKVEILTSSGSPMLDQAIRRWVAIGRYSPAMRDGRPLPLWINQGFGFSLPGQGSA